jgi:hypothetical protein
MNKNTNQNIKASNEEIMKAYHAGLIPSQLVWDVMGDFTTTLEQLTEKMTSTQLLTAYQLGLIPSHLVWDVMGDFTKSFKEGWDCKVIRQV